MNNLNSIIVARGHTTNTLAQQVSQQSYNLVFLSNEIKTAVKPNWVAVIAHEILITQKSVTYSQIKFVAEKIADVDIVMEGLCRKLGYGYCMSLEIMGCRRGLRKTVGKMVVTFCDNVIMGNLFWSKWLVCDKAL